MGNILQRCKNLCFKLITLEVRLFYVITTLLLLVIIVPYIYTADEAPPMQPVSHERIEAITKYLQAKNPAKKSINIEDRVLAEISSSTPDWKKCLTYCELYNGKAGPDSTPIITKDTWYLKLKQFSDQERNDILFVKGGNTISNWLLDSFYNDQGLFTSATNSPKFYRGKSIDPDRSGMDSVTMDTTKVSWISEAQGYPVLFTLETTNTPRTITTEMQEALTRTLVAYPPAIRQTVLIDQAFSKERSQNQGYNWSIGTKTLYNLKKDSAASLTIYYNDVDNGSSCADTYGNDVAGPKKCSVTIITPTKNLAIEYKQTGGEPIKWFSDSQLEVHSNNVEYLDDSVDIYTRRRAYTTKKYGVYDTETETKSDKITIVSSGSGKSDGRGTGYGIVPGIFFVTIGSDKIAIIPNRSTLSVYKVQSNLDFHTFISDQVNTSKRPDSFTYDHQIAVENILVPTYLPLFQKIGDIPVHEKDFLINVEPNDDLISVTVTTQSSATVMEKYNYSPQTGLQKITE